MPVQRVESGGRVGYRYGASGKVYWGPTGRAKALLQGAAMSASGYRSKKL